MGGGESGGGSKKGRPIRNSEAHRFFFRKDMWDARYLRKDGWRYRVTFRKNGRGNLRLD